jgi:hypothetical protein
MNERSQQWSEKPECRKDHSGSVHNQGPVEVLKYDGSATAGGPQRFRNF